MSETSLRLLLIEDHRPDALLFWRRARRFGFDIEPHHVMCMRDAIALLEQHDFDAIIADLHLPDSDGLEGVQQLLEVVPQTPVLVFSGYSDQRLALSAVQAGAQDYLVKGENDEHLKRALLYAIQRKQIEERLRLQAERDGLTGLLNKATFAHSIHALLQGDTAAMVVFYLDLNDFKPVNDTYGHAAGDELLRSVSERLVDLFREQDLIARLGGDEFAIAVAGVLPQDRIRQITTQINDTLRKPFSISGVSARISASVGVAQYPQDATSAAALLDTADQRMYAIKRRRTSATANALAPLRLHPLVSSHDPSDVIGVAGYPDEDIEWSPTQLEQVLRSLLAAPQADRRFLHLPAEALRSDSAATAIIGQLTEHRFTPGALTLSIADIRTEDPIVVHNLLQITNTGVQLCMGRGCGLENLYRLPFDAAVVPDVFFAIDADRHLIAAWMELCRSLNLVTIAALPADSPARQTLQQIGVQQLIVKDPFYTERVAG
ncbi:MAG: diguanylate cyclase [Myxococcota bacterium]